MDSDTGNLFIQLVILLILTLINAFFSASEMALVSVNKIHVHSLAEEGNKKAKLIEKVSEDSTRFLSTIQVAITLAGFASSAFAANSISVKFAGALAGLNMGREISAIVSNIVITVLLAFVSLVLGELVPKRIALIYSERFSFFCVGIINAFSKILSPFVSLLTKCTGFVLNVFGVKDENIETDVSEEEIKSMIETGTETGVFNDIEKEMINSIFSFDDKTVREVMTQRQDMVAVNLSEPVNEYIDEILESRHSRIPVYDDDIDNMIGILNMKDFAIEAKQKASFYSVDVRSLLMEPFFASENIKTDALFKEMQQKHERIAIIVDEYGSVSGMITLEDLVEEIVGDIYDENEVPENNIVKVADKQYEVLGWTPLSDINDELHLHIESECDTISGYVTELLNHLPAEEECPLMTEDEEAEYTVLSVRDRAVEKTLIKIKEENE